MLIKVSQVLRANSEARSAKKQRFNACIVCIVFLLFSIATNAQCAMCRAALSGEGNVAKAQAVNNGIVYLMVIPYVLVAGVFYAVYRMKKKK